MVQRYAGAHIGANGMYQFDNGAWVKYEDYAALKEVAGKALAVLEDYAVQIDYEWGTCRGIDQLCADGSVDDVLLLLKGLLHD